MLESRPEIVGAVDEGKIDVRAVEFPDARLQCFARIGVLRVRLDNGISGKHPCSVGSDVERHNAGSIW